MQSKLEMVIKPKDINRVEGPTVRMQNEKGPRSNSYAMLLTI
jgi:hypothetical protein